MRLNRETIIMLIFKIIMPSAYFDIKLFETVTFRIIRKTLRASYYLIGGYFGDQGNITTKIRQGIVQMINTLAK